MFGAIARPKWPKQPQLAFQFSEFQLCGHAAPPFRPREPPVAGSVQAASRARCGPDWRARHRSQLIMALYGPLRASCGGVVDSASGDAADTTRTAMQGLFLFCSWRRIGQVMQAARPTRWLPCPLPRVVRSAVAGAASCVLWTAWLRAAGGTGGSGCCVYPLTPPLMLPITSVRAEVGYDGRDKTQPPPTHPVLVVHRLRASRRTL